MCVSLYTCSFLICTARMTTEMKAACLLIHAHITPRAGMNWHIYSSSCILYTSLLRFSTYFTNCFYKKKYIWVFSLKVTFWMERDPFESTQKLTTIEKAEVEIGNTPKNALPF